jgi:hypothetical protein
MRCPNCNHIFEDEGRKKGGENSKRTDMGAGSEGQRKAQEGRKKAKEARLKDNIEQKKV